MSMADVSVESLAYAPGGQAVLRGVTLAVPPGEFLGILGPNGAGKSTLLRALASVLVPTEGVVRLDGRRIEEWSSRERACRIGFVPQQSVLTFPFRAEDVVLMGRAPHLGRWRGPDAADHRSVERAMALTDTESLAGRDVTTLSGGEMQRIALSRVLAQEPAVLLLDEPTASLDLRHQVEILTLLADLAREGSTVIAALHDLNLAATYCSTLVLLKEGRIVATGEPAEVMNAAVLREVFDVDVSVTRNPVTGTLQIVPLGPNGRGRKNRSDDGRESERWET